MVRRRAAIIIAVFMLSMPMTVHAEEVPYEVRVIAEELGARYGICPELLESIVYQESRFNPKVVSSNGLYVGAMQICQSVHSSRMARLGVTDLTDLRSNMTVGCDYLSDLFQHYEDTGSVLLVYSGSGKKLNHYESTGKMTAYVRQVLDRAARYERQHGK